MRDRYAEGFLDTLIKLAAPGAGTARFLSTKIHNPVIRRMNQPLAHAYKGNALVQGANAPALVKHVAHDYGAAPGAAYEVAELSGMAGKGLGKLAPHLGRASNVAGQASKGLGWVGKKVAPPAWAAAQAADFASMGFKDPRTGHWTTKHVGQNLAGNVNKELAGAQKNIKTYQDFYGKPAGAVVGTAANALQGFAHPGRTITSAGGGIVQTGKNLLDAGRGMGFKNTMSSLFRGRVAAPTQQEIQKLRAQHLARRQQPAQPAAAPVQPYMGGVTNAPQPVSMPIKTSEYINGFLDKCAQEGVNPSTLFDQDANAPVVPLAKKPGFIRSMIPDMSDKLNEEVSQQELKGAFKDRLRENVQNKIVDSTGFSPGVKKHLKRLSLRVDVPQIRNLKRDSSKPMSDRRPDEWEAMLKYKLRF